MPRLSVIVTVYNVQDYLERCLISLSRQTLELPKEEMEAIAAAIAANMEK